MKNNYVLYRVHISCSQKKGRKGYAVVIDTIYWCMFFYHCVCSYKREQLISQTLNWYIFN